MGSGESLWREFICSKPRKAMVSYAHQAKDAILNNDSFHSLLGEQSNDSMLSAVNGYL
jgi:hypothetical protein